MLTKITTFKVVKRLLLFSVLISSPIMVQMRLCSPQLAVSVPT